MLEDIAILTGGTVFAKEMELKLEELQMSSWIRCFRSLLLSEATLTEMPEAKETQPAPGVA
jgi:chaperonin GroEL (HSP60 family)